ncbi:hypothetical protein [uncultured Erythrobacter sp.]|uniref:hypothetical protein n=1 Tax=uncultured Erythrobacter sp. TaxID=263913 RepID=UPI0026185FF8|nr:hypothetical protein [uncultured Erythrobacter sp.]
MTKLPQQFLEDRALRDAAREVFMADVEHARTSISGKGIAKRVGSRVGDGAKDVFEVARVHADDNRGVLAALIGAILLFFAREPILEVFGITPTDSDEDALDIEDETVQDEAEDLPEPESDAGEPVPASGDDDEQ